MRICNGSLCHMYQWPRPRYGQARPFACICDKVWALSICCCVNTLIYTPPQQGGLGDCTEHTCSYEADRLHLLDVGRCNRASNLSVCKHFASLVHQVRLQLRRQDHNMVATVAVGSHSLFDNSSCCPKATHGAPESSCGGY